MKPLGQQLETVVPVLWNIGRRDRASALLRDLRLTEARRRRGIPSSRGVNRLAQAQEEFDRVRELKMLEFSTEALVLLPRLLKDL